MSTATPPAGGQTPDAAGQTSGQTPATASQTAQQPPETSTEDDKPLSVAEARRLREELKARRESEKAALAERDTLKKSLMTEEERKEAHRSELEKQNLALQREQQELRIERAVLLVAPEVGIKPALAMKLIDYAEIDTDKETGKVSEKSVKKALAALLEEFPELAITPAQSNQQQRPPAPRVPPTNPPASSVGQPPKWDYKNRPTWSDARKQPS